MTGLTSGTGTAYPSGALQFNHNLLFSVYCNPQNEKFEFTGSNHILEFIII